MDWIVGFVIAGALLYWLVFSPQAMEKHNEDVAKQGQIVCPHCHVVGGVTRTSVKKKQGISGGKATGAIFTGGISMLGTGLSRKENFTRFSCRNCGTTWDA